MKARRYLMSGFVLLILLGAFLTIGIINSRRVMLELMRDQARSFLSIVASTQENSMFAEGKYEDEVREQLINICNFLEATNRTSYDLSRVRQNFHLNSISIFNNSTLSLIIQSGTPLKPFPKERKLADSERVFFEYFSIGSSLYMRFMFRIQERLYHIEVSTDNIESFRRDFGMSKIITQLSMNPLVEYLVLQDREGILSATPNVRSISRIDDDTILVSVIDEGNEVSRVTQFEGDKVLELARPFMVNDVTFGIFRIGINLNSYHMHVRATERQLIMLFVILFGAGLVLVYLFTKSESYLGLKEIFHKTLDTIEDGVLVVNNKGMITGANAAFIAMSHYEEKMLVNHRYHERFPEDPFSISQVSRDGAKRVSEEPLFNRTVQYATYPLVDEHHRITGAIVVLRDVTQLRQFEKEREEAERLKFLGNLVANFAHEIKNPLNGLSIAAQRLSKEFSHQNKEHARLTSVIQEEIAVLNRTLNDFLSLARPRVKEKKRFSLTTSLKHALVLIHEQTKVSGISVREELRYDKDIYGAPDDIKRAFLNILLNAVDAVSTVSDRTPLISITTEQRDKQFRVLIADNGIGMDDEDKKRVFTPYFTTKTKGTGLGLYIAQQIFKDYNATIVIESQKQQGTTFVIEFN